MRNSGRVDRRVSISRKAIRVGSAKHEEQENVDERENIDEQEEKHENMYVQGRQDEEGLCAETRYITVLLKRTLSHARGPGHL